GDPTTAMERPPIDEPAAPPRAVSLAYDATEVHRRSAPDRAEARIGTVLARRYRLLRILGQGGMGTVYEAVHVELRKHFAVKLLSVRFATDDDAGARFLREARVSSAVESEHIVQVFDVGDDLEAGLYMVLELLHGEDLATHLARGRMRAIEAATIVWAV